MAQHGCAAAPPAEPFTDWADTQRRRALRDGAWKVRCEERCEDGSLCLDMASSQVRSQRAAIVVQQSCSAALTLDTAARSALGFECIAKPFCASWEL